MMRYVVDLQGTTWRRDNGDMVTVTFDPAHKGGNLLRTVFVQQTGSRPAVDKATTPKRILHNCTPINGAARAAHIAVTMAEGTQTDPSRTIPLVHCPSNFTGTYWKKKDNGKIVVVIADPAYDRGDSMRKLWVQIVRGEHTGREHASSPNRLLHAYTPACDRSVKISNGMRAA